MQILVPLECVRTYRDFSSAAVPICEQLMKGVFNENVVYESRLADIFDDYLIK